jgi:hypothetical protein
MQKSRQSSAPPRARKSRKAHGDSREASASRRGSPDWALEQQQSAGNQTVLGMIGGTRDTAEIAAGRPIGRMVEWVPQRGGETKCRCLFPPGTRVNVGDVGTIADKWGFRVERWEEINDNIHIEFVTLAPEDQFAWGNEVILGPAPPETVLEEVQQDETEGKNLLAAASGLLAASLLAPPGQQTPGAPQPGLAAAPTPQTMPGLAPGPAAPAAASSAGLAATMVAAAMGTPTPQQAAPTPGLAAPGVGAATPHKAGLLEAALSGKAPQAEPHAPSADQLVQQNAQAFARALNSASPDLATLQRIATSVQGGRLFELLGRELSASQVENLVRAGKGTGAAQGLLDLLEDRLYPQLNGGAQAAWDALQDEELVEQAAANKPAPSQTQSKSQA